MLDHAVLLENLVKHVQRSAAIAHEIFGNDLEPVASRLARKNVLVMGNTQTDADAVIGEVIEAVRRHESRREVATGPLPDRRT